MTAKKIKMTKKSAGPKKSTKATKTKKMTPPTEHHAGSARSKAQPGHEADAPKQDWIDAKEMAFQARSKNVSLSSHHPRSRNRKAI